MRKCYEALGPVYGNSKFFLSNSNMYMFMYIYTYYLRFSLNDISTAKVPYVRHWNRFYIYLMWFLIFNSI